MRRLLNAANERVLHLWKDESGVVLALTLVVFLTLFVVGSAVYAVGETVRQRVELQNAADAAAYSAAVVQADTLSRLAAINRAMGWTYALMVKREMDAIVDAWLMRSYVMWKISMGVARSINEAGECRIGHNHWYVGSPGCNECLLLNKKQWVQGAMVRTALDEFNKQKRRARVLLAIRKAHETIQAMNAAEADLVRQMPQRIQATVVEVLKRNIADTWNDSLSPARSADLCFTLRQALQPENQCFYIEKSAETFFGMVGIQDPAAYFGNGYGTWFQASPAEGVFHQYVEQDNALHATWDLHTEMHIRILGVCTEIYRLGRGVFVRGSTVRPKRESIFATEVAKPRCVKEEFFGKNGAIVVGLARRMNNPFQFMTPHGVGGDRGIYRSFTLDEDRRFMWTASAARAGFALPGEGDSGKGEYRPTFWPPVAGKPEFSWNLHQSDWDGVLLPLRRAWSVGRKGVWSGSPTGGDILQDLQSGAWLSLYGGGGALGAQGAPEMMDAGQRVKFSAAEDLILH